MHLGTSFNLAQLHLHNTMAWHRGMALKAVERHCLCNSKAPEDTELIQAIAMHSVYQCLGTSSIKT